MSRQTKDEVNAKRRHTYAVRTGTDDNRRVIRDLGILMDRAGGLSLRKAAAKRGVSVGCVRGVILRYQSS